MSARRLRALWPGSTSLRLRIFLALAAATLCGALATGLYAVVADVTTLGFPCCMASNKERENPSLREATTKMSSASKKLELGFTELRSRMRFCNSSLPARSWSLVR